MRLFREINLSASTFLVIGNIIGVGIFTTSGLIADQLGPSLWVIGVWVLGGVLALVGACCYAVLARHIPKAGGEYAFLYPSFGPLPAFLSGWASLLIGFSAPIAAAALGLSHYLRAFLPWLVTGDLAVKLIAAGVLIAVTVFISLGLRFGARLHSAVTFLNVGLIIGFSVLVLWRAPLAQNLEPLIARGADFSWSALGSAVILVMFGYSGWNAAAYVAEEVRHPRRNIPAALLLGTIAVMAAYVVVNLAYFGGVSFQDLRGEIAVAEITASQVLGNGGSTFVNLLILSSILSSLTAMSIAGPRVYFAMSRDRLFPSWLSQVDAKRKLPLKAIWFQSGVALVLIGVARFSQILLFAGVVMTVFTTLTVSVLFLSSLPATSRGVRFLVLYRLLPGFFVLVNVLVLINAAWAHTTETLAGVLTVAAGFPVYRFYQRKIINGRV